jgi:hypothetical protein
VASTLVTTITSGAYTTPAIITLDLPTITITHTSSIMAYIILVDAEPMSVQEDQPDTSRQSSAAVSGPELDSFCSLSEHCSAPVSWENRHHSLATF